MGALLVIVHDGITVCQFQIVLCMTQVKKRVAGIQLQQASIHQTQKR